MLETTTTADRTNARLPRWMWLAFGVLTLAAYFIGLNMPLVGPDEPRYAQVGREMMERGDWITPTLGGHPWFEKPALLYWLEIVSYKIFGVSEFAARLGPAIFGLGTVVALLLIGKTLYRDRGCGIGGYFAIVAASTLGIIVFSHAATFDIVITFPITTALACFWRYDLGSADAKPSIAWLIGFYAFVGVALLGKGLIGIVLPVGIVGCYYVLSRQLPKARLVLSLVWGPLISCAVASAWYVPVYLRHGWRFIDEFIIQQHFERFVSDKYHHTQSFYYFFWVLPLMILPWLPIFVVGVWKGVRANVKRETMASDTKAVKRSRSDLLAIFALAWTIVPEAFFSLSDSKLPGYILPAIPGAVVLGAIAAHGLASRRPAWRIGVVATAGTTLLGMILLAATVVPKFAADESVKPLIEAANAAGYTQNRVLLMHEPTFGAEFYTAGRLDHDEEGPQKLLYGSLEVAEDIRAHGGDPVLVLVPPQYESQLTEDQTLSARVLARNNDVALAAVSIH